MSKWRAVWLRPDVYAKLAGFKALWRKKSFSKTVNKLFDYYHDWR